MSGAIVPYRPAPPVSGGVGLSAGAVACDVRIASIDRRRAIAACDVTVANRGESDVSCRIFGVDDRSVQHEYGRIDVSAGALMSSHMALPVAPGTCGRVFVEVEGSGVHLRGETVAPAGKRGSVPVAGGIALAGLIVLGMLGVAPFMLHAAPPASGAAAVAPAVVRPAARIASMSAYDDARALTASYLAVGDRGTLRVIDRSGTVVAQAPFSHTGSTTIALPPTATGALRAELEVIRGASHARAAIVLPAFAAAAPAAHPHVSRSIASDSTAAEPAAEAGTDARPSDPFAVSGPVVGGMPFVVSIRRALPNLRLALQDEIGAVLDEQDVPPGATQVTLHAPVTTEIITNYLVGTYDVASTEQTLVRALLIRPH